MHDLLAGVRVLDLSTVVLGPYATMLLADMGADVIKVEPPEGDVFRLARPGHEGGDGAGFLNLNRNKRSIALDLSRPDDRNILGALAAKADVFVHNLRPRSAAKLAIDYTSIRAIRPNIVYCSARGFGEGPLGDEPAYDDCIQAASGLAWLNANERGEPQFLRTIVADKVAGLHLAFAAAAGLAARAGSGRGCHIETPMYEAMASFLLIEQLSGQTFVPPLPDRGYGRLNSPYRRPFRAADGYIAVMPYTAAQWERYLRIVGREDLAKSDLVSDGETRSHRIDELYALIADVSPQRPVAEWLELLRAADIPCAPVNRIEDLPSEPHLASTGFFARMDHPTQGTLLSARSPFHVAGSMPDADRPAPLLDADRAEILAEIGRTG